MKRLKGAFTLVELLLTVFLIMLFSGAVIYNFTNNNDKIKYDEAKDQLKSYILYNKYKAVEKQTKTTLNINTNENSLQSPIDDEIEWLTEFTAQLKIIDCSKTNIDFQLDGTVDEAYIDIVSNDGNYSNRLNITSIGTLQYSNLNQTNNTLMPSEIE